MNRSLASMLFAACLMLLVVGAGQPRAPQQRNNEVNVPVVTRTEAVRELPTVMSDRPGVSETNPVGIAFAPNYYLNWWSVNGGGTTNVNGTNFDLGVSVGQAAAGFVTGTNYKMGVGYWYGAASGACPIAVSGDGNVSGSVTSADIIVLVNFVFKGGAAPLPCEANGDVNCNGAVTSSDIIVLVNYVFKGGAAPCDICTIIPSLWSCP